MPRDSLINSATGNTIIKSNVNVIGKMVINEPSSTTGSGTDATLLINHATAGGTSSIVFTSATNRGAGADYAYIRYSDNRDSNTTSENSLLTIGVDNDTASPNLVHVDNMKLAPSGWLDITGNTNILSTLPSSSTTTGALTVAGGVGVFENVNVGGNVNATSALITGATTVTGATRLTNNTGSTSTSTGALVVTGGVGIGGNVNAAAALITGATTVTGATSITNNTPSTTSGTGALLVTTGGVGVSGNVNVGGNVNAVSALITGATTVTGATRLTNNTASTSTSTGALVVGGGVGVAGNVFCSSINTTGQPYLYRVRTTSTQALPINGSVLLFPDVLIDTASSLISYDSASGMFSNISGRELLVLINATTCVNVTANAGVYESYISKRRSDGTAGLGYVGLNSVNSIRLTGSTAYYTVTTFWLTSLSATTKLETNERFYVDFWMPVATTARNDHAYPNSIQVTVL